MQRITYLVPLMSFCLSAVVFAQEAKKEESKGVKPAEVTKNVREPKALDIVKKADTAIRKITSVQYTARREISGPLAERLSPAEATVIYRMESPEDLRKFRTSVKMKPRHSEEELRFTVGSDGDLFYLIDAAKKIVYEDMDPAVAGNRGGVAKGLILEEYTVPEPCDDELNADTVGYQGTQAVGCEDCYVIRVVNKRSRESIWYFSTKDYLPRRRDTLFKNRQGETSRYTVTLTDLVVGPTIDDNTFKLVVPEGFTETDEFAPDLKRNSPQ